jgi:methylase of polypeptide subunit release factors
VVEVKGRFDVVIGNPPYVSTKGVDEGFKKVLKKFYGFSDDLYNHFYFKGIEILRENGILAFISSKTFWTIQTKKNLRELILDNKLLQLVDTANPFESAMVDTCITIVQKTKAKDYEILFIDARDGLDKKKVYKVKDEVYKSVANNVFFVPSEFNLKIYEKLGKKVKELLDRWWDKISSSKNIEKYKKELEAYRSSLKAGDITLLGLITEGGVGIQTGNNGKYIGVLEGTKWAEKVRKERPEKLWNFIKTQKPKELSHLKSKKDVEDYLNSLSEKEIRKLFDDLKEKYGRDIFGQGWLYRIVSQDEIADVDSLSDDEKLNGIDGDKTYVPYDKGDKEGNRWWAPTPYYIDWSRENIRFLKENSGKKGEGMPVVRNPQFYFKEGFCWNNVTGTKIICRIKEKSVHSTEAMTFISLIPKMVSDKYLICLMNSSFFGLYKNTFLNITVHLTTGDAKEFPIIIPTPEQLKEFELIFDRAKGVQEEKFSGKISEKEAEERLEEIQKELDEKVLKLYGLE